MGEHALEQRVVAEAALVEQPVRQRELLVGHLVGGDEGLIVVASTARPLGVRVRVGLVVAQRVGWIFLGDAIARAGERLGQGLRQPAVLVRVGVRVRVRVRVRG